MTVSEMIVFYLIWIVTVTVTDIYLVTLKLFL